MATYASSSHKWLMMTTFFVFSSTLFLKDTYFSLNLEKHQSLDKLYVCLLSHFNHIRLSATLGLQPTRLLCPWDFSGKNTGVGCHTLLQGIFPTQELKLGLFCLLYWQMSSLPPVPSRKPLARLPPKKSLWKIEYSSVFLSSRKNTFHCARLKCHVQ